MYVANLINHRRFPDPGVIVLKGGDHLFFNEDVRSFYHHVLSAWNPPPKQIALYMGCSRHKPFSRSFLHMKLMRMLVKHGLDEIVQQFIVSEPLTICPRELEKTFPAANYDFPPQHLGSVGRKEFILRLRTFLQKYLDHYEFHVGFMPNHHKQIFIEASEGLAEIEYVPYNLYYLPQLLQLLRKLKTECEERPC